MPSIKRKPRPRPRQHLSGIQEARVFKIVLVLAFLAVLWIVFAPGSGVITLFAKRSEIKKLQQEVAQIEQQIEILENDIDRLHNDPSYLEEIARKKYLLLRKNEILYDFENPKTVKKK